MTLTYFTARSMLVAHAFEWRKLLQCHLKGKTCSKLANGQNLYYLKKKVTPENALTLPWGYIRVIIKKNGAIQRGKTKKNNCPFFLFFNGLVLLTGAYEYRNKICQV